jgi:hypothetical protein
MVKMVSFPPFPCMPMRTFPSKAFPEPRLLGPIYVRPGPAATPAPIRYVWITYTFAF